METIKSHGDFFARPDIKEFDKVIRYRTSDVSQKGYPDGETKSFTYQELTTRVFDETGLYALRGIRYNFPETPASKEILPHYTFVFIPGGAGSAVNNTDMLARLIDQVKQHQDQFSDFNISSIVVLPHVASQARTNDLNLTDEGLNKNPSKLPLFMKKILKKGTPKDAAIQPAMGETARILEIFCQKFNITTDIIGGYSMGGAQAIEMAGRAGELCKYLLLLDPAGIGEHPDMEKDIGIGEFQAALKKYKNAGGFKKAVQELLITWGTEGDRIISLFEIIKNWGNSLESQKMARTYGFADEKAGTASNNLQAKTDSTFEARKKITAKVIFAPIEGAKVLNIISACLKDVYPTIDDIKKAHGTNKLESNVLHLLNDLFPSTKKHYYAGYLDTTHSSIRVEKDFWNNLFSIFTKSTQDLE